MCWPKGLRLSEYSCFFLFFLFPSCHEFLKAKFKLIFSYMTSHYESRATLKFVKPIQKIQYCPCNSFSFMVFNNILWSVLWYFVVRGVSVCNFFRQKVLDSLSLSWCLSLWISSLKLLTAAVWLFVPCCVFRVCFTVLISCTGAFFTAGLAKVHIIDRCE